VVGVVRRGCILEYAVKVCRLIHLNGVEDKTFKYMFV